MRPIFLFVLASCFAPAAFAQTNLPPLVCGNDVFHNIVTAQYPDLQTQFDAAFDAARQPQAGVRSPLTVNVVVHVVWKEDEENLSDDIIYDQIAVLNADYNRLNADTGNLRPVFQPAAGNADIHFNLASIERVQTSTLFEVDLLGTNLLPEVKHTAQGGSDAWDTEHYLNIWVCNIQPLAFGPIVIGQILGFAFPPADLPNWPTGSNSPNADEDGVVIDFRAFGSNNPNPIEIPGATGALTIRGRTPVHEVGHYFGLRHIWGDGGVLGPNECDQSDGIDDTPYANSQSNFDCDQTKNSCSQVEAFYGADVPDMIENYMDYASEDCMNVFTKGQVEVMRNVLQGPRSGLLESVATQEPAVALFRLYPNPAASSVVLEARQSGGLPPTVRLFGADGRVVRTFALSSGEKREEMDLGGLPAGLYFAEWQSGQENVVRKLVIL